MKCPSPSPGSGVAAAPPLRGPGSVGSWKSRATRAERSPRRARLAASLPRLCAASSAPAARGGEGEMAALAGRALGTRGAENEAHARRRRRRRRRARRLARGRLPCLPAKPASPSFFSPSRPLPEGGRAGERRELRGVPRRRGPLCAPLAIWGGCCTLGGSLPVSSPPKAPFPPWVELGLFKSIRFVCFWLRSA